MSFNSGGVTLTGQFDLKSKQPIDGRYVIVSKAELIALLTTALYPGLEFTLTLSAETAGTTQVTLTASDSATYAGDYKVGTYKVKPDGETLTYLYDQDNKIGNSPYKYELQYSFTGAQTNTPGTRRILINIGTANSDTMVLVYILGNSYSESPVLPINTTIQFYDYSGDESGVGSDILNTGAINHGVHTFSKITVYRHSGNLYLDIEGNQTAINHLAQQFYITIYSNKSNLAPKVEAYDKNTSSGRTCEEPINIKDIDLKAVNTPASDTNFSLVIEKDNLLYKQPDTKLVYDTSDGWYLEAPGFNATSDARLKENFRAYTPEKSILDLPIYKFDFIDGAKNQIGCKAQDLREICPELVNTDSKGYLSIKESKLVYLLMEEVKQLKEEVKHLKEELRFERY